MSGETAKRSALAGTVALSVLLTGCGAEKAAGPAAVPATSSAASAPASPATPAPSATPSPRATPLPRAKDGKRLRACADATCEVVVSDGKTITLNARWGLGPIRVTVGDGSVSFGVVAADGTRVSMSEQTPDQGGPSVVDGVAFEVVAVRGKQAVVKIGH